MGYSKDDFEMAVYPGTIVRCSSREFRKITSSDKKCDFSTMIDGSYSTPVYISELTRSVKLGARPLTYGAEKDIASFKSYNSYLLDFLRREAMLLEAKGNTCTTLFFDEFTGALLAFCSTKCSTVKVKGVGIHSLLPTIELAVLCVDDRYRYKGIGAAILGLVLDDINKIRQKVGIELVTLFAVPPAVAFYKQNNFRELKKGTKIFSVPAHQVCTPMYLPLPTKKIANGVVYSDLNQESKF